MNPYGILNVSIHATDEEIRNAYLAAIRRNPPEANAEAFQAIVDASNSLKDERARLRHHLGLGAPSALTVAQAVIQDQLYSANFAPPSESEFRSFLRSCLNP